MHRLFIPFFKRLDGGYVNEAMELIEYKNLAFREKFFWWNVGRRRILRDVLRRNLVYSSGLKILDVGCGPGGNMLFLKDFGEVTGLDASDEALVYAREFSYRDLVLGSATDIPFSENSFDCVVALDVIEHIEDDRKAFSEMFRVLKPGGVLLLTVPAYQWMWSSHDEVLHHKRRYQKKELHVKIKGAGFLIVEASHFVFPSIPFRAGRLLIQKIRSSFGASAPKAPQTDDVLLPVFLNTIFIFWLTLERYFIKVFPLPWGSSLLVLAKKPAI